MFAGGVDMRHDLRGDLLVADLRVSSSASWVGVPVAPFDWKLNLAEGVPVDLVLEIGASENRIDLRRVLARSVRLSTGASSTTVWLPERAGHSRAEVHAGAAEVRLIVPAGVEARVTSDSGLADVKVASRFVKSGGAWESPGYATAENRVDISLEVGVGSVRVD